MSKKLVVAAMPFFERSCLAMALLEDEQPVEFTVCPAEERGLLGNIYLGIVENIQKNIGAAFVRIQPGLTGYLPLSEQTEAVRKIKGRESDAALRPGDELLVQVAKEAIKQKQLRLTTNLSFSGKYLVLTTGKRTLNFSKRLYPEDKTRLRRLALSFMDTGSYGIIVRTNAAEATEEELREELSSLRNQLERVVKYGVSRTCCSCLLQAPGPWIDTLKQYSYEDLTYVVTDQPEIFREISSYLEDNHATDKVSLKLYRDEMLPLHKLYRFSVTAESLNQKQIWLKSGGFLVIEQTEAFVSIDVNTGKYSGKKDSKETFHRINLEAAEEAARQIRLRQLSGTILIDFINMEQAEHKKELLQFLQKRVSTDPVKTRVIDMTALQIVEMTRTKERKSFAEQLKMIRASGP